MRNERKHARAAVLYLYCVAMALLCAATFMVSAAGHAKPLKRTLRAPDTRLAPETFRSDGAQLVHATTGSVSAQNPAFSPDGNTLIGSPSKPGSSTRRSAIRT